MPNDKMENLLLSFSSFYPSPANHRITVVEDRCLSGRDRCLRLIKLNPDSTCLGGCYRRRRLICSITYAHIRSQGLLRLRDRYPVHALGRERLSEQFGPATNHELIPWHIDLYDVERFAGSDSNAPTLPDSVAMQPRMLTDNFPALSSDLPGRDSRLTQLVSGVVLDKPRVVAVRDKTDLLALWLLGCLQPDASRYFAHLCLGHVTERKFCARELL